MKEVIQAVEENSLRVTEAGYEIQLRIKWYRALPLSCIENFRLALDGQPVDPSAMRFGINGHQFRIDELRDLVEEFWFVLDSAILSVNQPGAVKHGESHQIDCEFGLRFPYIPIGPGKFLTQISKYSGSQIAN